MAGVVSAAAGAVAATAAAPTAVAAVGFTQGGILAGSSAAWMMSTMGGAATQAGSAVALLQAVGATGTVLATAPVAVPVAVVGAGVGYLASFFF